MARKVIWSLRAQQDRKAIFTYWNKRNKSTSYSKKLNLLFNEAIGLLTEHPQIGRKTSLENMSIKIVRDYLIIYEATADSITIHTVWDGRRNPLTLNIY